MTIKELVRKFYLTGENINSFKEDLGELRDEYFGSASNNHIWTLGSTDEDDEEQYEEFAENDKNMGNFIQALIEELDK